MIQNPEYSKALQLLAEINVWLNVDGSHFPHGVKQMADRVKVFMKEHHHEPEE